MSLAPVEPLHDRINGSHWQEAGNYRLRSVAMKLNTPVRTLGPVDYAPLKAAVCAAPSDAWLEDVQRQVDYAEVHSQTQSIILLFCEGWPQVKISKRKGWDRFSAQARPVVQEILERHYHPNGTVIRAVIAKLLAGGVIETHEDSHPTFAVSHRIHVPLVTNDSVDFSVGGELFHLQEGIAYEISNLDAHGVHNRSDQDRLHFIFDYFPG